MREVDGAGNRPSTTHPPLRLPLHQGHDGVWRTDWAPLVALMGQERVAARLASAEARAAAH